MKRGPLVLVGAVAVASLAAVLPASAHHADQTDPNDTLGKLDVRAVELDHDEGPPLWRIETFGAWTVHEIWDRGFFVVQLDTKGDESVDHLVIVRSDGRKLVGSLYVVKPDGTEKPIDDLPAAKDGSRAVTVSVPLRKLAIGATRQSYFWSVLVTYTGNACQATCFDSVPDSGMIEQLLPGVTPSPTPSPTVSPTPTPTPTP
jgi:hypothetical protein